MNDRISWCVQASVSQRRPRDVACAGSYVQDCERIFRRTRRRLWRASADALQGCLVSCGRRARCASGSKGREQAQSVPLCAILPGGRRSQRDAKVVPTDDPTLIYLWVVVGRARFKFDPEMHICVSSVWRSWQSTDARRRASDRHFLLSEGGLGRPKRPQIRTLCTTLRVVP